MSDLDRLIADLAGAGQDGRVLDAVEPVVKRGAVNIKKAWRESAQSLNATHAKHYHRSIGFEIGRSALARQVAAEVGPDKDKTQGALGNLLEFGGPDSAPQLSGQQALDDEADEFERQIAKAERRLL